MARLRYLGIRWRYHSLAIIRRYVQHDHATLTHLSQMTLYQGRISYIYIICVEIPGYMGLGQHRFRQWLNGSKPLLRWVSCSIHLRDGSAQNICPWSCVDMLWKQLGNLLPSLYVPKKQCHKYVQTALRRRLKVIMTSLYLIFLMYMLGTSDSKNSCY